MTRPYNLPDFPPFHGLREEAQYADHDVRFYVAL